ncbi:ataxin-3 isoform X2 [Protopterus annectens]|nr:ataxin-3 isoform X2 [Protopterus annectens]
MAEGGTLSEEYRTFLQQPSGNMDDSGYFSIQVISDALRVWGLELTLFNSPEYRRLRMDPVNESAFICNYKEHWFTIRKLGNQWFNLNSLLTGPELISDTYLALFLAQLQQEGYSIFVVKGELPDCEADEVLRMVRVQQRQRPTLIGEEAAQSGSQRIQRDDLDQALAASRDSGGIVSPVDEDEQNFQRALALSRQQIDMEDEEADLRRAIQLSMQGMVAVSDSDPLPQTSTESAGSSHTEVLGVGTASDSDPLPQTSTESAGCSRTKVLSSEELRMKRQAYFEKQQHPLGDLAHAQHTKPEEAPCLNTLKTETVSSCPTEDEDTLQAALTLSLECATNSSDEDQK